MKLNLKRCAKRLQRKLAFRQNGFLRAMEQTSLSIDPAYIGHLKGEVDIESVVSVIEKIFVPKHFPLEHHGKCAIFMAEAVLMYLKVVRGF